jgi:hypothetical protein
LLRPDEEAPLPQKLAPLPAYDGANYPVARSRMLHGLMVAASMTATSLGGCGPGIDSRTVDSAVGQGDLDATVDGADGAHEAAAPDVAVGTGGAGGSDATGGAAGTSAADNDK